MKIARSGANRYSGEAIVQSNRPARVFWEAEPNSLHLSLDGVSDPSLQGEYNYQVRLDLADIANMLNELAARGLDHSPAEISDGLAGVTRALHRLLTASSGLLPEEPARPGKLTRRLLAIRTKDQGTAPEDGA